VVVSGPFFISCGDASELFAAIHEPLNFMSLAIDGAGEGPGATRMLFARDGQSHAMLPRIRPDLPAAVPLIPDHAPRAMSGPATPMPLHRAAGHHVREDHGFVPRPRRQHRCEQLTISVCTEVDLCGKTALAAAERFGCWVPLFAPAAC
jgi:hypothetical protein